MWCSGFVTDLDYVDNKQNLVRKLLLFLRKLVGRCQTNFVLFPIICSKFDNDSIPIERYYGVTNGFVWGYFYCTVSDEYVWTQGGVRVGLREDGVSTSGGRKGGVSAGQREGGAAGRGGLVGRRRSSTYI
jgi:hypothetical protein